MIRCHIIGEDQTLNRRHLEELFLEAAGRVANVTRWAIGDLVLERSNFEEKSFQDMYFNYGHTLGFKLPEYNQVVPYTNVDFKVAGGYFEASIQWSLEALVTGSNCYFIAGWPVLNGEALWHLLDYRQNGTVQIYNGEAPTPADYEAGLEYPQGSRLSLGHSGVYNGLSGSGASCVMMLAVGDWEIVKSAFQMQVRYR